LRIIKKGKIRESKIIGRRERKRGKKSAKLKRSIVSEGDYVIIIKVNINAPYLLYLLSYYKRDILN